MIARVLFVLALFACPAAAQDVARIVYVGIVGDPFYEPQPVYTGLSLRDIERPVSGIRLAFRDARVLGRALGVRFELEEMLTSTEALAETIRAEKSKAPLAILLDLPSEPMAVAVRLAEPGHVFINIRDPSDGWRGTACATALLHTTPSYAMLSDALAQHLRAKGWSRVLLLHGATGSDLEQAEAARRSAMKFGLKIADEREFELTNDPRRRDQSNIALLTGGVQHDVVWLIDSEGEFGRYVPFATYAARPVVGSEGLMPEAWHWTFERYGSPQLNQRFRRIADRDMTSADWSAWVGVRVVVDAIAQAGTTERRAVHEALLSQELSVDLYKGVRGNFRDWDGQLRQPVLLATHNAVISVAPVPGFEHQTDTLDTLGFDRAESQCRR